MKIASQLTLTLTLAMLAALPLTGCVNNPSSPMTLGSSVAAAPEPARGPGGCKYLQRQNTNTENAAIGAGIGAFLGGALGRGMADNKATGTRNGAVFGALAGALAGSKFNSTVGLTQQDDGTVRMNIPGSVLFRSGSAELSSNFQQMLVQVASTVREYCGLTASVIGHTDNVGGFTENQRLSEQRARAVVNFLITQNIEPTRLTFTGRAYESPVASNNDEAGRAQNRRVEIFIRPPQG